MKLVLGIVLGGLLAAVVYTVLFQSSFFSGEGDGVSVEKAPKKVAVYSIEPEPQVAPEPTVAAATPQPTPKTIAAAKPVEPVVEETEPEENWEETDEDYAEEDVSEEEVRRNEIKSLREALPNNILIPFERTPEEVEALMADAQEVGAITQAIEENTATLEERQRYMDIVSKQFDDEIELINYCNDMSGDPSYDIPEGICKQVVMQSDERLEEIEKIREELRKKIMQEN